MKADFLTKVQETIKKYDMIQEGERLLVGLSGGADSVALLLCLKMLGYQLEACHINHNLRGEESDRDQEFCEKLCKEYGLTLIIRSLDVVRFCQVNSLSTEAGARILRYQAFDTIEHDKLCTAHNLNDCLETTLFNLARGTGLKGLSSIPPVRGKIIRPLINCSRREIENFLEEVGQSYVTDSTNLSDDYDRNKLRHRVIPVLQEINESLLKTYRNTADHLREDSSYLESLADQAYEASKSGPGHSVQSLLELAEPIRRRVILRLLEENGLKQSTDQVLQVEALLSGGRKVNLGTDTFAEIRGGVLRFYRIEPQSEDAGPQVIVPGSELLWKGRSLRTELVEYDGVFANVHKKFKNYCLDYGKIKGELVIRERTPKDRVRLCNREHSSDVRILVKDRFPIEMRPSVVILADDMGVVFVEGCGCADRVKLDEETALVLGITVI